MISVALAGGGERVVAWEIGVLAGLADAGLDLRGAARIVGTSAGALVAARLAAGEDPRDAAARVANTPGRSSGAEAFGVLATAWQTAGETLDERRRAFGRLAVASSPGGEEAFVARQAALLGDAGWSDALRIVAIDADSGERVVFDAGSGVPLARAVAASRAVPTLRPPVRIGDRRFIDGALGSATNADLLIGRAIVVAPFAPDDPLWAPPLRDEVTPDATIIHAGADDLAAMGPDPMSGATAELAVRAGRTARRTPPPRPAMAGRASS
jgi:NTE family protein